MLGTRGRISLRPAARPTLRTTAARFVEWLVPFVVVAALAAPAAASLQPLAPPRALDGPFDCGGAEPDVAALAGGGFVGVWTDGVRLQVRRLDAAGLPIGQAVHVADTGDTMDPAVVALPAGGYAVVWFDPSRRRLFARFADRQGKLGLEYEVGAASPFGGGYGGLDVAVTAQGHLRIGWTSGGAALLREQRVDGAQLPQLAPLVVADYGGFEGLHPTLFDPVVVVATDGSTRMFWVYGGASFGTYTEIGPIAGARVTALDDAVTPVAIDVDGFGSQLVAAMRSDGSYLLAWSGQPVVHPPVTPPVLGAVLASPFSALDEQGPTTDAHVVTGGPLALDLVPVEGGYLVAWQVSDTFVDPDQYRVYARELALDGNPRGPERALAPPESWGQAAPALAIGDDGLVLTAWQEVQDPDIVNITCPAERIQARPFRASCSAGGTVCLGGRFELELAFTDRRDGLVHAAQGVALTPESGYFWFFSADNVEVVAKVIDGWLVNGHYWLFYGSLTDMAFTLTVTDAVTGARRQFQNPPRTMASRGVTDLFPTDGLATGEAVEVRTLHGAVLDRRVFPAEPPSAPTAPARHRSAPMRRESAAANGSAAGPCSPPELPVLPGPGLCLSGRRFEVAATWRDFAGNTGVGQGVSLGDDSGYLWFFHPDNVEVVVKALDARLVDGHFWVFVGALTNVEYDLAVRHVLPDELGSRGSTSFHNPPHRFASHADLDTLLPPQDCGCPAVLAPVCGSDGVVYGNECEARCEGWVATTLPSRCSSP
jgi:hypothetical protein